MISSTKNYTKKKNQETDRQNPRTNGKSKAIQTKSHKGYTHTLTKREKGKKYIYLYIYKKRKRATKSVNIYQ